MREHDGNRRGNRRCNAARPFNLTTAGEGERALRWREGRGSGSVIPSQALGLASSRGRQPTLPRAWAIDSKWVRTLEFQHALSKWASLVFSPFFTTHSDLIFRPGMGSGSEGNFPRRPTSGFGWNLGQRTSFSHMTHGLKFLALESIPLFF